MGALAILLTSILALSVFGAGEGEFIPLKDGEILVGEVQAHDEFGLSVRRLDTGGLVQLRWSHLAPPFEKALREKLGYTYDESAEILVEADEITFLDGTRKVGRIVEQTPERVVVKDSRSSLGYARSVLAGAPVKVRVPALDVYTKDELYTERLSQVDTTTAQGNLELARYLELIQDFARSQQHYAECKRLDPKFHEVEIGQALTRVEQKKLRQEEFDYLREIEVSRYQQQWDKAIALCDGFAAKFPKALPASRQDVEKRRASVLAAKQKAMVKKTYLEFFRAAETIALQKASDRKLTIEGAKNFAANEMKRLLVEKATKSIQREFKEVNEQEAVKLFGSRGKEPKVRHVSYGNGTFALGSAAARKGIDSGGGSKASPAESQEEAEMAKKLKRLLERTSGTAGGQAEKKKLDPAEEWWQTQAAVYERAQFLLAYFVEYASDFERVGYQGRTCVGCGGVGSLPVSNVGLGNSGGVQVGGRSGGQQNPAGGGYTMTPCPTCRGTGFARIVLYR